MQKSHQRFLALIVIAASSTVLLEPRSAFAFSSNQSNECPSAGAACSDHCSFDQNDMDNVCWMYYNPAGCCAIGDPESCGASVCDGGYQVNCTFEPDIEHSCGHYD